MTRRVRTARRRMAQVAIVDALIAAMAALGCSGNRQVSVGGSMHMSSGGAWAHSFSVGIQGHRVRR